MGLFGVAKRYCEDWLNGYQGRPPDQHPGRDPIWEQIRNATDALGELVGNKRFYSPTRVTLGEGGGQLKITDPQTSVLAIAPPRKNKTAGLLIPATVTAPGPVVSTSSKPDVFIASAMARARVGDVWHFSPTDPPAPGAIECRWSPVVGAKDYDRALLMAQDLVRTSAMESQSAATEASHRFFTEEAIRAIAPLINYANIQGLDMEFPVETLASRSPTELQRIVATLHNKGSMRAARDLAGILQGADRQRSGVLATASVALRAYEHSGALKAAKNPNFDPVKFVAGEPEENSNLHCEPAADLAMQRLAALIGPPWVPGRYGTLYITTGDAEDMTAPLVVTLIQQIRRAAYAQARKDELSGTPGAHAPTTLVLDEMSNSPIPDLPQIAAEAASRGCVLIGALQSPAQAVARWGQAGKSFLSLWQNLVIFPGLRDDDIHLLSSLGGEYDREVWGGSESTGQYGVRHWNASQHWDRMRNLPPDLIARGDPRDPDKVLVFTPNGGYEWIRMLPYYRSFWTRVLVQSSEWSLRMGLTEQPLPDLNRTGDYRYLYQVGGQALVNWWKHIGSEYSRLNQEVESA
jgi:type IV secretory pathway TraG/TraD family ATPase VirD4